MGRFCSSHDDLSFYSTFGCSARVEAKDKMKNGFIQHIGSVTEYFLGRPKDLLIFDVSTNDWKPLCRFLDFPVPRTQFPHMLRYDQQSNSYVNRGIND